MKAKLKRNILPLLLVFAIFSISILVGLGCHFLNSVTQASSDTVAEEAPKAEVISLEVPEETSAGVDHAAPTIASMEDLCILEKESVDLWDGVSATDAFGKEVSITLDDGGLDCLTAGSYEVLYTAEDEDGCISKVKRMVTVEPLVYTSTSGLEIQGAASTNIYIGTAFDAMEGITLSSAFDPNTEIQVDASSLDVTKEGSYTISYHATNLKGQTVYVYRTINVYPAPVMWGPSGGTVTWDVAGRENQPYLVAVNRLMNTVTVYGKDADGNYTNPVAAFACSCGLPGCDTITGTYTTSNRYEWRLMVDGTYGRYAIRIEGNYLFHSVPYLSTNANDLEYEEFNKLGNFASLGCVRMAVADVYWLYVNCPTGFTTVIYDDAALAGPLGKPTPKTLDVNNEQLRGIDPTDPQYNALAAAAGVILDSATELNSASGNE